MKKLLHLMKRLYMLFPLTFMILAFASLGMKAWGQTVTTDKDDYAPGEWVIITGSGWEDDQQVKLTIVHKVFTDHPMEVFYADVDGSGNFIYDKYQIDPSDVGEVFELTVTGMQTGQETSATFTDSNLSFNSNIAGTVVLYYADPPGPTGYTAGSGTVPTTCSHDGSMVYFDYPTLIGYTISFTVTDGDGVVITNESVITENNLFGSITYKYKFNAPNAARRIYGNYTLTCIPPTITLGSNPSVCKGSTSADLTYSTTANDPTEYTIDFNGTAEGAGFADVAWTALPLTPITIILPEAPPAATYDAVLKVRSSATCESDGYPITVTVNPLPMISFGFNEVEAGHNATFEYCYSEEITVDIHAIYAGVEPFSVTYTIDGGTPVTVSGLEVGDPIFGPQTMAAGIYAIAVTDITDANGCKASADFLALCQATVTINPEPMISFGFNGVEAGHNATFGYCYGVPVTVDVHGYYGGTAPYSVTYTINGGDPETVTGLFIDDIIYGPETLDPDTYNIAVTDITDANGCKASPDFLALCQATVTINPLPEVTAISLLSDTDFEFSSASPVAGDLESGYTLNCLDPLEDYYYLDINEMTVSEDLQEDFLNPFYLDDSNLPSGFMAYWDAKGVNVAASGGWQEIMWDIITGEEPMLYILLDGTDYKLIDGLQYLLNDVQVPFMITGDYPIGTYTVSGTVKDINGCISNSFDVDITFTTRPEITCPANITAHPNDKGKCGAVVSFGEATATGTTPITIEYFLNYGLTKQALVESGNFFPVGTTTVTAVATNDCGSDECTFTVEVTDTEDPVITCPGEIIVSTDPGECGANVDLNIKDKIDVLLISAEPTLYEEYPDEVKQKLMATGYFNSIDLYAARLKTPANVSELENYDAVLVWSNDHFFSTIQLGNVLVDYINMGGGVVLGAFAFTKNASCPDGSFATDEYRVIVPVDFVSNTQAFLGTVNFPLHPLMKGVNSFDGGSSSYRGWSNTLTTNSYLVAKWTDGLPLIAAKENVGTSGARRVDVNFYPPSSDSQSDYWDPTTDGALILANALTWVANTTESDGLFVSDNCGVQSIEYFVDDVKIAFPYNFPVGTTTVDVLVTDVNNNTAECDFDVVVTDDEDPEITCPTPAANYDTDPGECDRELTFEFLADDNCGVDFVTYTINEVDYVLYAEPYEFTYVFQFGTTTVKGVATDIHGNVSEECSFDVVVDNVTTILEVTVDPGSQQYTDMVTLTATLTPWDCSLADCTADGEVEFTIGNQVMGKADLIGGVAELEVQLCGDFNLAGTLGTFDVSAVYTPDVCDDYLGSEDVCVDCLEIVPEVACAVYSGVYYASTGSINSTTATVVLAATVISDDDSEYCDITNAKVQFLVNENVLATVPVELLVGEIGDGPSIGTASYEWTGVPVGTYDIRVKIVGGYYTIDTEGDCDGEAIVVVGMPSPDFITGGGYVIMENSMGLYAGTTGLKNNFGFNVKYNRKMTNLQGNINTIVRRMEYDGLHIYQVKGNVMSSLTVNGNSAVFTGKANIQDITDPDNPIPIAGNCNMQFTMTDNGEPGTTDMISVTVWKSDGGMWFTTNWADNKPAQQVLDGGNLVVHSAKAEPVPSEPSTPPVKKKSAEIVDTNVQFGHFAVYPNPFSERVLFEFVPAEASQARIDMLDITGRLVKTLFNQPVEAGVLYNAEFKPDGEVSSFYIYRIILGESLQTGKLIYRE